MQAAVWPGWAVIVVAAVLVALFALSGGRGRTPRSRRGNPRYVGHGSGGSGSGSGSGGYAWVDATGGGSTDCGGGSSGGGGGGGDGGGGGSC